MQTGVTIVTEKIDGSVDEEVPHGGAKGEDDTVKTEFRELRHELQGLDECTLKTNFIGAISFRQLTILLTCHCVKYRVF